MPLFGKKREADPPQSGGPRLPPIERFYPGQDRGHRVTREASGVATDGRRVYRSGTGVSLVSKEEAGAIAIAAAQRNLAAALGGTVPEPDGYLYTVTRALEPVIDTLRGAGDEELARITLNSYAAVVMNARSMLFADIDGRGDDARLESVVARNTDLAFRVYRTPAGARYLCTSRTFDPRSSESHALLAELGSDPKYALLCRIQNTFRARLTPKPWRAGHRPMDLAGRQDIKRGDLERFLAKLDTYAAAHYERTVGSDALTLPELVPLIDYHDLWSRAASDRPLA